MKNHKRIVTLSFLAAWLMILGITNAFAGPANTVVVAKSGGDFTSIQAAIYSVNPTATDPVVINVMPGTYAESLSIFGKGYLHLQGSGKDVTIIQGNIVGGNAPNLTISNFTIVGPGTVNPVTHGIAFSTNSSLTIAGNEITGHEVGIGSPTDVSDNSTWVITENIVSGNSRNGIEIVQSASTTVTRNTIKNNGLYGAYVAVPSLITQNELAGNGSFDLSVSSTGMNVSANIVNTVKGKSVPGQYNVKSDGTALRLP